MKRAINLVINCGDKTCASKPEHFCEYAAAKRFGKLPWCKLWDVELADADGWLLRCPACLKATGEGK